MGFGSEVRLLGKHGIAVSAQDLPSASVEIANADLSPSLHPGVEVTFKISLPPQVNDPLTFRDWCMHAPIAVRTVLESKVAPVEGLDRELFDAVSTCVNEIFFNRLFYDGLKVSSLQREQFVDLSGDLLKLFNENPTIEALFERADVVFKFYSKASGFIRTNGITSEQMEGFREKLIAGDDAMQRFFGLDPAEVQLLAQTTREERRVFGKVEDEGELMERKLRLLEQFEAYKVLSERLSSEAGRDFTVDLKIHVGRGSCCVSTFDKEPFVEFENLWKAAKQGLSLGPISDASDLVHVGESESYGRGLAILAQYFDTAQVIRGKEGATLEFRMSF